MSCFLYAVAEFPALCMPGASVGDVTTTFFALITGAFSLGGLGPIAQAAGEAISAAIDIWDVLDGEVTVDVYDDKAGEKRDIVGDIVISKLVFAYPIRPDVQVLRGLSLHAVAGKSVALGTRSLQVLWMLRG